MPPSSARGPHQGLRDGPHPHRLQSPGGEARPAAGAAAPARRRIIAAMRRRARLPEDVEHRLATLGAVLDGQVVVRFAYVFGGAGRGKLRPLSDVDVAVYLDETADLVQARLDLIGVVTKHLGTD